MKSLGDQVKEFRRMRGWNTTELAAKVRTSRQNIESLEASGNRVPKYIADLAVVMGTTTDQMLEIAGLRTLGGPLMPGTEPSASPGHQLPPEIVQLIKDLADLPKNKRSQLIDQIHQHAEEAREAFEHLSRVNPSRIEGDSLAVSRQADKVALASRTSKAPRMSLHFGDGNDRQAVLPLVIAKDPFTAHPDEREAALYQTFERAAKPGQSG